MRIDSSTVLTRGLLLLLAAYGCQPSEAAAPLDEPPPPPPPPPPCRVTIAPSAAVVGWGARLGIDIVSTNVARVVAPEGWRFDADRSSLRAPYRSGPAEIRAEVTCSDGTTEVASLTVDVEAPTWRELPAWTRGDGPPPLMLPNLWIDRASPNDLYLLGGLGRDFQHSSEVWRYSLDRERWSLIGSVPGLTIRSSIAAPLPGASHLLLLDENAGTDSEQVASLVDYGGEAPSMIVLSNEPPAAGWGGGALVWVPHLLRFVIACGGAYGQSHCDAVTFDPATGVFEPLAVEGETPGGRFGFAYGYDEERRALVVFSGASTVVRNEYVATSETWELDLSAPPYSWTRIATPSAPSARVYNCSVFDPSGRRLFVFAGGLGIDTVDARLFSLDLDAKDERWIELELPGGPPARALCSAVYDAAHDRLVVGFGNGSGGVLQDLWTLDL